MIRRFANPIWALMEYGWYPLLLIVATPWFLAQLGTEKYGYWMLLTATVGFGGILKTGTGAATIKAISAGVGRADGKAGGEVAIRASLTIAIFAGGALGGIVLCVFYFGGERLLGHMQDRELIRSTAIAAGILIWLEQLDNVFTAGMKGTEQFGRAAQIQMASRTLQVVTSAAILWFSTALPTLYSGLIVITLLRLFAKAFAARLLLGRISISPSFEGIAEILQFAKWGWLQGVGGVLFGVADRLLVGSVLGATSLTYYSIASQLTIHIHGIAAAGLSVIFPFVSRKLESKGYFSLWRVAKLTFAANVILSSVLAAVLVIFGAEFLNIWVGESAASPTAKIMPWLVGAYWVLALGVVPYYILLGMGRIRFVSIAVTFAGAISAVAMYFAVVNFGLLGAPTGRFVYAILSSAIFFPLIAHFLRERRKREAIIGMSDGGDLPV